MRAMVDWESMDWNALERLRDRFLRGATAESDGAPYWTHADELAAYDFTFGRRIGWKWSSVLEPLLARGWKSPARTLVDWGCGTAIGARSLLAYLGADAFDEIVLWDHSPLATDFARAAIERRHSSLVVRVADPIDAVIAGGFVLVVSHVLNELAPPARDSLMSLAQRAAAVLWIEPGAREDSRALIAARERLRATFHCIAPCPHRQECGMLADQNARHWCHHFARPPTEAFTEGGWAEFSRRLGIDLRALPYSYLVLDRKPLETAPNMSRIIGHPRESSGLMRILRCRDHDVREIELQKRDAPPLWRTLAKGRHDGLLSWTERDGRIVPNDA